jgi:transcriptional regulator with PAS, ATPase and Fis domain
VNCAALPESLLESELFGFEKGAFTGANVTKPGKFELANHGTLLLDEIGEMAPILQAKLLRVLQEKEVDRIGGKDPVEIDVRVIATTNRDLYSLVQEGEFREDLYYRLNVVCLTIPPLRERPDDIPLLVDFFCKRYGDNFSSHNVGLSQEAMECLIGHDWPGNVRELENTIQRAVTLCTDSLIRPQDLLISTQQNQVSNQSAAELGFSAGITMREMERQLIQITLEDTRGNRTQAAKRLGISLRTLRNKLNEFGLQDRQAKSAYPHAQ